MVSVWRIENYTECKTIVWQLATLRYALKIVCAFLVFLRRIAFALLQLCGITLFCCMHSYRNAKCTKIKFPICLEIRVPVCAACVVQVQKLLSSHKLGAVARRQYASTVTTLLNEFNAIKLTNLPPIYRIYGNKKLRITDAQL